MKKINILIMLLLTLTTPFAYSMDSKKRKRTDKTDTLSAKRVKTTQENQTVTLVNKKGEKLTLSKKIAYLSGTIKNLLANFPNQTEIPVGVIDFQTLTAIKILMELEHYQKLVNNITKANQSGTQECHTLREAIKKCIAQRQLMQSLPINTQDLAKLFSAASFLDTQAILNAIIHTYAQPHLPNSSDPIIDFEGTVENPSKPEYTKYRFFKNKHKLVLLGIPREAINHLAKTYFILHKKNIIEPNIWLSILGLSVSDYAYNDPHFNPTQKTFLHNPSDINFKSLQLTTLEGLQDLSVEKQVIDAIDLSDNWIQTLTDNVFVDYTGTTYLNAQNNRLTHINPNAFIGLGNLTILDLSGNCFGRLTDAQTFVNLPNLQTLKLNNALITYFDPKVLVALKKLKQLTMTKNPWPRNQKKHGESFNEDEKEEVMTRIRQCCPSLQTIRLTFDRQTQHAPLRRSSARRQLRFSVAPNPRTIQRQRRNLDNPAHLVTINEILGLPHFHHQH